MGNYSQKGKDMTEEEKKKEEYGMGDFLKDFKEPIGRLINAFGKRYEEEPKHQFRFTALALFVVVCVIASIVWLGSIHVLSDNTISFVLGSGIGYVFSFLGELLPQKD